MNRKALEQLYHDALASRIKGMGFPESIAESEADRIIKQRHFII